MRIVIDTNVLISGVFFWRISKKNPECCCEAEDSCLCHARDY